MDFDSRDYRDALGRFATGVTIVSTASAEGSMGITVNSFTSISLDPPVIAWSLGRDSLRYDLFSRAEWFAVNVLAHDQERLAARMAETSHLEGEASLTPGEGGAPLIDGAVARFQCRLMEGVNAGDHRILLGRVIAYDQVDAPALAYYRSRYGRADNV